MRTKPGTEQCTNSWKNEKCKNVEIEKWMHADKRCIQYAISKHCPRHNAKHKNVDYAVKINKFFNFQISKFPTFLTFFQISDLRRLVS